MLQKRLDYGHNGYQVPFIPRATRSARRRGPLQKKAEDDSLCAFDLLATVAGKILLEGENPDVMLSGNGLSNVQDVVMEDYDEGNPSVVVDHCDQVGVEAAPPSLTLELGIPGLDHDYSVKDVSGPQFDAPSAPASVITAFDCLKNDGSLAKIDLNVDESAFFSHSAKRKGLAGGGVDSCVPCAIPYPERLENGREILFGSGPDSHSSEDPEILDGKSPALVSSDSSVKLTLGNGHYPCSSPSPCRDNNVNVGSRDDDENSSECTQPSTIKSTRLPARIGDRRIRKLLASKYWRVASKSRDGDLSDTEVRCLYRSKRIGYKRQRSQRIYPFKKRRFFRYNSISSSHADIGYKGVYNIVDKAIDVNAPGFGSMAHGVNGSSACIAGQSTTFSSRESHVKLRIKSFRVPELFIEMPETATVGSLKRTVMEAVTALLGGGLRVGVLLQGKKIRDDNRTLSQSGICHDNNVESLGFSLEPNPSEVGAPVCSEDHSLVLSTDMPQPVSKCPFSAATHQGTFYNSVDHLPANLGHLIESDYDSAPSPADLSAEKGLVDSRALVSLPDGTPQALSVVSSHQKSKQSDMGQRRIRRPFSVGEVEALVQAVEKLGTGRWRDVKLRAFDNVKHRTYVDLKDKWKTLVHTARIAPQQRRGEPVPQELLDRVLAAHAYWSQQQAKLQLKQQPSETCLLL